MNKQKLKISSLLPMLTIGAGAHNSAPEAQATRGRSRDKHQGVDNPTTNPGRWLETMKRTCVKELFLNERNLPEHVRQIYQEINLLTNGTNGLTGAQLARCQNSWFTIIL